MNVLQCRRRVFGSQDVNIPDIVVRRGQEFIPPYQKSSVQRSLHWPLLLVPALLTTHLLGFKDDLALKAHFSDPTLARQITPPGGIVGPVGESCRAAEDAQQLARVAGVPP